MNETKSHTDSPLNQGYLICASPRSGSTLLCDLLKQSGVAGSPESFFRPESINNYARYWKVQLTKQNWNDAYVQAVRQHSGNGTGYVGVRMMWSNVPDFSAKMKQLYPKKVSDKKRLLDSLGIERYIHLSRDDKVAQAVSLVTAKQTGLWHLNSDGTEHEREISSEKHIYNHEQIAEELRLLDIEEAGWECWFKANAITPLRITYEELSADPLQTLSKVMSFLGQVPPSHVKVATKRWQQKLIKTGQIDLTKRLAKFVTAQNKNTILR